MRIEEAAAVELLPRLRGLLIRWTRNVELANDLSQEVVLRLVQAIREGRIRSLEALPAYAHRSARNAMLMSVRAASPEIVGEVPDVPAPWGSVPQTPLEVCEQGELNKLANLALDSLSTQRDRDLIRGFYIDARSKPELMLQFGLTRDQFDKVISRARARMRELLAEKMRSHNAADAKRATIDSNASLPSGPA